MLFSDLPIRDDLRSESPYGAPQIDVPIQLNVNENTHPIPEDVARDIVESIAQAVLTVNRYPDREFVQLREDLAAYVGDGASVENLWAANGSNEILQQIMQAMEESGTEIELVYASGGFIESDFWVQLLADVLNKRVIISRAADASAMGAIFLGLHALGFIKDWSEVKRLVVTSETFSPIENNHKLYARNANLFSSLYTKLAPDFAVLAEQN